MADDTTQEETKACLLALEEQVANLEKMTHKLTLAVLDTAKASGYRIKHIKLARTALQVGYLKPEDWV